MGIVLTNWGYTEAGIGNGLAAVDVGAAMEVVCIAFRWGG